MYILPIYLKLVRSFSSQFTGTLLIPGGVSGSIASLFAGAYMQRTGKYKGLTSVRLPLLFQSNFRPSSCILELIKLSFPVGPYTSMQDLGMFPSPPLELERHALGEGDECPSGLDRDGHSKPRRRDHE
jgi:hypothetical protein